MTTAEEARLIRVVFPGRGGRMGEVILPWVEGKSLHSYLADPTLSQVGLFGKRKHCRVTTPRGVKVRMRSVLAPGDTVIFRRV